MDWETWSSYLWTIGGPVLLIVIVTLWVFRPGSRRRYQRDAQIPFQDEEKARASAQQAKKVKPGGNSDDERSDPPS